MDPIEFAIDGWLMRADDAVLEVFGQAILGSLRLPLKFAAVSLETRKNGIVRFRPGLAPDVQTPFYAGSSIVTSGAWMIDLPSSEEASLRSFLDQVATRTPRPAS